MTRRAMRALGVDLNVWIEWWSLDLDASWSQLPNNAKPIVIEYRPDLLCADGW